MRAGMFVLVSAAAGAAPYTDPVWSTTPEPAADAQFGAAVALADVNGDGLADIVAAAPSLASDPDSGGRVYAFHGRTVGPAADPDWSRSEPESGRASLSFGRRLSTGDVDTDGFEDLLVAEPGWAVSGSTIGRFYLYSGSPSGLSSEPAWTLEGTSPSSGFADGGAIISLGGSQRLVVLGSVSGAAYGYLASGGVPAGTAAWQVIPDRVHYLSGRAMAGGDVDGDGHDDLVAGAFWDVIDYSEQGAAYWYRGSAGGLDVEPSWSFDGPLDRGWFGYACAIVGDVNGDGFADVAVGAPEAGTGHAYLFFGGMGGPSGAPDWSSTGPDDFEAFFGAAITGAGDLDGDGFDDFVVGAPNDTSDYTYQGRIDLWLGGPAGPSVRSNWHATFDAQTNGQFGSAIAGGRDVNGDGIPDLVVGAAQASNGAMASGEAYLLLGTGACAGGCDDSDPCTDDACVDLSCEHTRRAGCAPDAGAAASPDAGAMAGAPDRRDASTADAPGGAPASSDAGSMRPDASGGAGGCTVSGFHGERPSTLLLFGVVCAAAVGCRRNRRVSCSRR